MPVRGGLVIEITPEPAIIGQVFFAAAEKCKHMEEPLMASAQIASEQVAINFESEGRPDHWQALAESTQLQKDYYGFGEQILVRTGALRDGATSMAAWRYRILATNQQAVELTDPTGYGEYHITGTSTPMPARDWTYIDPSAVDQMVEIMADWIVSE